MEAIKGQGLAGAQLTTTGARGEGDTDQDPRLYRKEQVKCTEGGCGGGLAICSAAFLSVGSDFSSIFLCTVQYTLYMHEG